MEAKGRQRAIGTLQAVFLTREMPAGLAGGDDGLDTLLKFGMIGVIDRLLNDGVFVNLERPGFSGDRQQRIGGRGGGTACDGD